MKYIATIKMEIDLVAGVWADANYFAEIIAGYIDIPDTLVEDKNVSRVIISQINVDRKD